MFKRARRAPIGARHIGLRLLASLLTLAGTMFGLHSGLFTVSAGAAAPSPAVGASLTPVARVAAESTPAPLVPGVDFVGLNVQTLMKYRPVNTWAPFLAALPEGQMRVARVEANWSTLEPLAPVLGVRSYRWDGGPWGPTWSLDTQIGELARLGVRAVPVVAGAASWAGSRWVVDAAHHADFAAFVAALDARYGPGGTFWRTFTAAPALPVLSYEIYNEVNAGTIDAPRYAALLAATAAALQTQRSGARLMASMAWEHNDAYLRSLWAAGGGKVLGGVAFHAYGMDAVGSLALIRGLRATLTSLGAAAMPITVTEIGQPADLDGPGSESSRAGRVSDATRAGHQELVADAIARSDCGVDHILQYAIVGSETDREPLQEGYMGVLRLNGGSRTRTALALQRSSMRWAAELAGGGASARSLSVCGVSPVDPERQLPLTLALRSPDVSTECLTADVTYQGNPIELATLTLRVGERTIPVDADGRGTARLCLPRTFTDGAFTLSASVGDVGRSATVSCWTATLECVVSAPAPAFWSVGNAATPAAPESSVKPPHDPPVTPVPPRPPLPRCGWVRAPVFSAKGAARRAPEAARAGAAAGSARRRGSVQLHLRCQPLKTRTPKFRVSVIRAGRKQAQQIGAVKLRNGSASSFTPPGRFGAGDKIVVTRKAQAKAGIPKLTATAVVPR